MRGLTGAGAGRRCRKETDTLPSPCAGRGLPGPGAGPGGGESLILRPRHRLLRGLTLGAVVLLVLVGSAEVWAHSRTRHASPPLPAAPRPAAPAPTRGQAPETDPLRWQDLFREVNVRGLKAEEASLLLQVARLAGERGELAHARWAYRLLLQLFPGTDLGARAWRERLVLDFYQELAEVPGISACRRLVHQLLQNPKAAQAPVVRQALREGWRAVEQQLMGKGPFPPPVAEQLLELWELTPAGMRPPEAKLLLARLFQDRGLPGEARQLLEQVAAGGEEHLRREATARLLELAWAEQGLGGFLAALAHLQTTTSAALQALWTWPLNLEGSPAVVMAASVDLTLSPALRLQLWEALSGQPLPGPLTLYLLGDLARMAKAGENVHKAAALYHEVLETARENLGPGYYYDRIGLEHLRQREWLAAQEAFQAQTQAEDPLWQQLGRVRLMEVELAQIQAGGPR